MDDLGLAALPTSVDPRHSPFMPSLGTAGYVFLPSNIPAGDDRIVFYDAGELEQTGSTQAIGMNGHVIELKRADLFTQPGVPQP